MRIDIVSRNQQAGCDRNARGAQTKSDGVNMPYVNAGKFGAELLLRDGTYRPADVGKSHEKPERKCDCKCGNKTDNARDSEKSPSNVDCLKRVRNIDGPRIGPKCIEKRVFYNHSDAKSHQQHVAVVTMRSRADDESLQGIANHKEHRRKQKHGSVWIKAKQPKGKKGGK